MIVYMIKLSIRYAISWILATCQLRDHLRLAGISLFQCEVLMQLMVVDLTKTFNLIFFKYTPKGIQLTAVLEESFYDHS